MGDVLDVGYSILWGAVLLWLAIVVLTGRSRGGRLTRRERTFSAGTLLAGTGIFAFAVLSPVLPEGPLSVFAVAAALVGVGLVVAS